MAVLVVTKEKGGVGRPLGMTVVPPSNEVPLEKLRAVAAGTGLDGVFLADLLSAMANHERIAVRFSRAAMAQAQTSELRELHEKLAQAHAGHLDTVEALMRAAGLDPLYASPASRMVGHVGMSLMQAPLLAGSVDAFTMECATLDATRTILEQGRAGARALAAIAAAAKPSSRTEALRAAAESLSSDVEPALEQVRAAGDKLVVAAATREAPRAPAARPPSK